MNPEIIRQFLKGQPFEPFEVHLTSGEVHRVPHPELALLAGSRLIIYYPDSDRVAWISLLHIASVVAEARKASA